MATCTKKRSAPAKITTMEEAVALLDQNSMIEHWSSWPHDDVTEAYKNWLTGAARAWLLGHGQLDALMSQLPALRALVQKHIEISLNEQASDLEGAIVEPGALGEDTEKCLVAAAPAAQFVRVWLKHRASRERAQREMAQIPSPDEPAT